MAIIVAQICFENTYKQYRTVFHWCVVPSTQEKCNNVTLLFFGGSSSGGSFSQSFCEIKVNLDNYKRKEHVPYTIEYNPKIQTAFAATYQENQLLTGDARKMIHCWFWYKSRYLVCFIDNKTRMHRTNITFYDSKQCKWHKCKYTMPFQVTRDHKLIRIKGTMLAEMIHFVGQYKSPHFQISLGEDVLAQKVEKLWKVERLIWICYYKRDPSDGELQSRSLIRSLNKKCLLRKNSICKCTSGYITNGYLFAKLPKHIVKYILCFLRVVPKLLFVEKHT